MNSQGQTHEFFNNLSSLNFSRFSNICPAGKLAVAFAAFALICLSGWLMDFTKTVVVSPAAQGNISELQVYLTQPNAFHCILQDTKR